MLDNLNSNFESSKAQRPDANDDEVEIDLLEIFYALKKKILLVLMVALVGGCIAAAYTQFLMTPIYSSTSSILVLSKETTLTSLADLQLGASLTSDYTVLITSTPVMEQVISDLDLDMTAEQLKGSVSINNPTDTRILEITVNNTDSKMAKKIVDEIANVSSSYIGDKMEVIPPKIIEVGKIATVRTSPSVKKNAALGFLLGFLACAAIVVVYAVMDDTIKTEEDIAAMVQIFDKHIAEAPDDNKRQIAYRNRLLFFIGMNVGIRASDLRTLKWSFFLNKDGTFKDVYVLQPMKQRKQGKFVKLYFNQTVKKAVQDYLFEYPYDNIDEYLFTSRKGEKPIVVASLWRIISDTAKEAGIVQNIGSHSLRKSWGYWCWHNAKDKQKALVMLQCCFSHSSTQVTMKYIGLQDEEVADMYYSVELGLEYM